MRKMCGINFLAAFLLCLLTFDGKNVKMYIDVVFIFARLAVIE